MRSTKTLFLLLAAVLTVTACGQKRDTSTVLPVPQRDSGEALRLVAAGDAHAEAGRIGEADELYRRAISLDNRSAPAWNNMGELLLRQEKYADAVQAFQVAADLSPGDPRPPYNAGLAYQQIGWADDARTHFTRALERDGNYLPALRGAIRAAESLNVADSTTHEHIRRALLRETDDRWRAYIERQRFRVEDGLRQSLSDG